MHKFWRNLAWTLLLLAVLFVAGFTFWSETPAKPMPEALSALQSDALVTVTTGKWLVFSPQPSRPTTGLILYPGGRVDYRAYAPAAHQIAAAGSLVVIIHVPLNLAVFDPGAATAVIAAHPEIKHWAVGGHSLGGTMASNFAHSYPGIVQGLVLWASYPANSDNLSQSTLKVLSISGTLDGLSTPARIDASRALLPVGTVWVPILGGDHAQFGWYGPQAGDNAAAISREDQQRQIILATITFLESLK